MTQEEYERFCSEYWEKISPEQIQEITDEFNRYFAELSVSTEFNECN